MPPVDEAQIEDLLAETDLKEVTIVCMREEQAKSAAQVIEQRTGVRTTIVSSKVPGSDMNRALASDVVLFVWMATTHAIFRAFDNFDRAKLCYVQGTGSAAIIRTLEKWAEGIS